MIQVALKRLKVNKVSLNKIVYNNIFIIFLDLLKFESKCQILFLFLTF